jgi:hypothetical protein
MYVLIALGCFAAAVASQFGRTRSATLAQVSRFRALGVSDDRARQFYQETALAAFKRRWPAMLWHGTLLSLFSLSVCWLVLN